MNQKLLDANGYRITLNALSNTGNNTDSPFSLNLAMIPHAADAGFFMQHRDACREIIPITALPRNFLLAISAFFVGPVLVLWQCLVIQRHVAKTVKSQIQIFFKIS